MTSALQTMGYPGENVLASVTNEVYKKEGKRGSRNLQIQRDLRDVPTKCYVNIWGKSEHRVFNDKMDLLQNNSLVEMGSGAGNDTVEGSVAMHCSFKKKSV